jgi:DNA-binding transcriptional LysR family regulator
MTPELRLIRYFVAVAEVGNITRAAQRLHISQPSLSAAVKQLEAQLGTPLLTRHGRRVMITPAGETLLQRGRELLDDADALVDAVRARDSAIAGRLRLGLSPTARYGIAPRLLAACADQIPAVMIYTSEDTTGALLRDVADHRLDLAVTFCAPVAPSGVELSLLAEEPAVVHLPADHPLAQRPGLSVDDVAGETILVAASSESAGFTNLVLAAFADRGIVPRTLADPYPDLGLQAVRERLGVVVYARSAFPAELDGSAFVPLRPPLCLPYHLAYRTESNSAPISAVRAIAAGLHASTARPTSTSHADELPPALRSIA